MEGVKMSNQVVEQVMQIWPLISSFIFVPHTEAEYNQVVALLDELIDEVGEDEEHPLASLMELLGTLIEKYEAEYVPELIAT
jgi:HTH-type transcriptional regulator/antitoxin HigA